jgi:hypothetical protein
MSVISENDLRVFFRTEVHKALSSLRVDCNDFTEFYLVNLLAEFGETEELFEDADRPLALLYGKAMEAGPTERFRLLKKLGDFALYMSGYFSDSLSGKAVDVDYYISMGSTAYGSASKLLRAQPRGDVFGPVFNDLSGNFPAYVDVLAEVSDKNSVPAATTDKDVMRLYELWVRTRSKRCEMILRKMGVSLASDKDAS